MIDLKELEKNYGHLFNIVDYDKLKWYEKLIRFFKRKYYFR